MANRATCLFFAACAGVAVGVIRCDAFVVSQKALAFVEAGSALLAAFLSRDTLVVFQSTLSLLVAVCAGLAVGKICWDTACIFESALALFGTVEALLANDATTA